MSHVSGRVYIIFALWIPLESDVDSCVISAATLHDPWVASDSKKYLKTLSMKGQVLSS